MITCHSLSRLSSCGTTLALTPANIGQCLLMLTFLRSVNCSRSFITLHTRSFHLTVTAASIQPVRTKMTQGALTQAALIASPAPLIDIGVNLVDSCFSKVRSGCIFGHIHGAAAVHAAQHHSACLLDAQDRSEVLERARAANVQSMIVTGTCIGTSRRAKEICEESTSYPLYFTAGVHPHHAKECNEQ